MTTVVGILNKRGVAIAADSAVTRKNKKTEKYTKNGNKMIRLCESSPVGVMLTGNNDFLGHPWEVIVRKYRSERGKIEHASVKDAADDFFDYLSKKGCFWDVENENRHLDRAINYLFDELLKNVSIQDANVRNENGTLLLPSVFVSEFKQGCKQIIKQFRHKGRSPHFTDKRLEEFRQKAAPRFDVALFEKSHEYKTPPVKDTFPMEILNELRPLIEKAVFFIAGQFVENEYEAILVFTGYGCGPDQKYPSLVAAKVNEGFDGMVNYRIEKEDIVEISEKRPVAICPFAQDDVINALLEGADDNWTGIMPKSISNKRKWEKKLEKYDLRSMAELAECLVDMTGFQRILTFQQEGVGGAVDLAVISKTDGFCWLRRKDWYPRYSSNQYGNFGI